jgi:hypothetical protein
LPDEEKETPPHSPCSSGAPDEEKEEETLTFVCEEQKFQCDVNERFVERCRGTFFEQFLAERWNHPQKDGAFVVTSIHVREFEKVWFCLTHGWQWPVHKTIDELFLYKEALQFFCLNVPEILAPLMVATPSFLQIPQGQGKAICTPMDTQIQVTTHLSKYVTCQAFRNTCHTPRSWSSHRSTVEETYGGRSFCQRSIAEETSGGISFCTTSLGVFALDADRGVLSLSVHGIAQEFLRHVALKKKTLLSVLATSCPFCRHVIFAKLQPKRKKVPIWVLYRSGMPPQFMRGQHLVLKNRPRCILFLECFPRLQLHVSDPLCDSGFLKVSLVAPKEADDITFENFHVAAKREMWDSYTGDGIHFAHTGPGPSTVRRYQSRLGKGSPPFPKTWQETLRKGRGGKGGMDPLRVRHPRHAGSCLNGEMAKDVWIVERLGQVVVAVQTKDGRVAVGQIAGESGTIPRCWGPTLSIWGLKGRGSYKRRVMVPRAGSIEGVLPLGKQIYIYHTTRPDQPLKLWKVDVPDTHQGRCAGFFVSCDWACNPCGKGVKGNGKGYHVKGRAIAQGSWMNYWGEGEPQTEFPRDFFKLGSFPPDPVVGIDSSCVREASEKGQHVEIICCRRIDELSRDDLYWNSFAIAHTIAQPPSAPAFEQDGRFTAKPPLPRDVLTWGVSQRGAGVSDMGWQ